MSGATEWVINGNEGTTEEGLFLVFSMYVWYFRRVKKIVLIKYSGKYIEIYFNLKITYIYLQLGGLQLDHYCVDTSVIVYMMLQSKKVLTSNGCKTVLLSKIL